MIVVSNTTPLIGLAVIGRFDVLPRLFGHIVIPQAVYNEAVVYGREQGGARDEVMQAAWIKVQLGLLLRAKELGLMPAIRPEIERLRETGFSVSDRPIAEVLRTAGE